jgi:hypothetical protein
MSGPLKRLLRDLNDEYTTLDRPIAVVILALWPLSVSYSKSSAGLVVKRLDEDRKAGAADPAFRTVVANVADLPVSVLYTAFCTLNTALSFPKGLSLNRAALLRRDEKLFADRETASAIGTLPVGA